MDKNIRAEDKNKPDVHYINPEMSYIERDELNEKKVDAFFEKLEKSKRTRINDTPKRIEGRRYVTKDSDVIVSKSDDKKGYTFKATETGGLAAADSGNDRRGVRRTETIAPAAKKPNTGSLAAEKKGKPEHKPKPKSETQPKSKSRPETKKNLKPAKKKSVVMRIIGIIYGTIWRLVLLICCLGVITVCAVAILGSIYLINVTKDDDKLLNINNIELSYSSMLMCWQPDETAGEDSDEDSGGSGGTWVEYQRIFGGENRVWIKYMDMPENLINAIVASEDQHFWENQGVDWRRTAAAFANAYVPGVDLFSTQQGASTIVQQLIKNITEEDESQGFDGALRKLREIYRALILSRTYSNEQILETYLNTFRLSGRVAGIEAGANYYFNKTTGELSAAESAAIVCITKAPGKNNPYTNPDENRLQRDTILNQMHDQGYLTDGEWKAAKVESAFMVFDQPTEIYTGVNVYSWFADTVIDEVLKDFVAHNFRGCTTRSEAFDILSTGGYRIYMTIDLDIQDILDDVRLNGRRTEEDERLAYPREEDGYLFPIYRDRPVKESDGSYKLDNDGNRVMDDTQPQSAFVVMNMMGEIKGIVGGLDEKEESMSFNRATMGTRSTGSSMKPLAAYGPAIEADVIHFSWLFPDDPIPPNTVPGLSGDWPRNYDRTYGPPVTVAAGIARSLNTTAIWTLHMAGSDFCFDFMKSFLGLESLNDPGDRTYSLALGGLYEGVTPVEMCAAYAAFGNGGYYYSPHSYTVIMDARDEVVFDKTAYIQKIKSFSDETAYIMNRLLYNVMHPGFAGTGVNACPAGEMDYVGKSGTHSDDMDFWFIGMNPYYVMAIWEGYDIQDSMESLRPHPVQLVFHKVMTEIEFRKNLEPIDFPVPETGVRRARFCMASGDLASGECPDTRTGYYKESNMPGVCSHANAPDPNDPAYAWPRPTVPEIPPPG